MKWVLSFIRLLLQTAAVCVISLMTTWYVVHLYVDDLLAQFHITTPEHRFQLSQMISTLAMPSKQHAQPSNTSEKEVLSQIETPIEKNEDEDEHGQPVAAELEDGIGTQQEQQEIFQQPAVPVWGQQQTGQATVMTQEDFAAKKDALSESDRWKLFEIMLKLPPNEAHANVRDGGERDYSGRARSMEEIVRQHTSQKDFEEVFANY